MSQSTSAEDMPSRIGKYVHMVTFQIRPEDEALFNEIYDSEHLPNILRVPGVLGCLRLRDLEPDSEGHLVYTTVYVLSDPDLPGSAGWREASDLGRWAAEVRPRILSRQRRYARIVADS